MASTAPLRVVYLEPLGITGGMGHYNDQLAGAYRRSGFTVQVITTTASRYLLDMVRVRRSHAYKWFLRRDLPAPVRGAAYALGNARALGSSLWADIVVVHFLHQPLIDYLLLRSLSLLRKRLVLVAHDPEPVATHPGRMYRRCLGLFDVLVVHGPAAKRDLLALGTDETRIVMARFGEFRPMAPMTRDEALSTLGLLDLPAPTAAIIGNLKPGKGVQRALESLDAPDPVIGALLLAGQRQGKWDLAGVLARHSGTTVRVVHVDRRMTDEEERAAYSAADVVLALYESGYSSGVTARAHALRRSVVMTDVGDLRRQAGPRDAVVAADATREELNHAIADVLARVPPPAVSSVATTEWDEHVRDVIARLDDARVIR
ncbi:MAG TPA: glycosyltransferase [Candidatus Limnocylindrales bacterium]|jgi:glycosyltransferase involved in cell wall biosynthesis